MPDLTVKDVATRLGVDRQNIRKWLREGKFQGAYRLSRAAGWRIPSEALEAFIEERRK